MSRLRIGLIMFHSNKYLSDSLFPPMSAVEGIKLVPPVRVSVCYKMSVRRCMEQEYRQGGHNTGRPSMLRRFCYHHIFVVVVSGGCKNYQIQMKNVQVTCAKNSCQDVFHLSFLTELPRQALFKVLLLLFCHLYLKIASHIEVLSLH